MGSDQADLLRNRKLRRLSLVAEPLGVDLGVFAVGDDLLQTFVDLVAQLCVALAEAMPKYWSSKDGSQGHVELLVGVLQGVVRKHADVAHGSVNAACGEFFEHERGVVKALDVAACLAENLAAGDVARPSWPPRPHSCP